ncbi:MAG: hypothetical protein GY719_42610 [bacterium]|nr:hypothetical protein [bacterium]
MISKKLVLGLGALTLAVGGWDAHADRGYRRALQPQHHHYDHGFRHPERFDHHDRGVDCDRYSEPVSGKVCVYGRNYGQAMATSLGTPSGQHDGFLAGYGRGRESGLADGSGRRIDLIEGRDSVHVPGGFIQRLIEDQLDEVRARAAEEGRERGHGDAVRRFEAILDNGHPLDDRLDERALVTSYSPEWGVAERLLPRPGIREMIEDDLGYRQRIRVDDHGADLPFQQAGRQLGFPHAYAVWELDEAADWARDSPSVSMEEAWRLFFHTDAREQSPWAMLAVDHPQSWYPPEGLPGNPDLPAIFKQAFLQEYDSRSYSYYARYFRRGLDEGADLGYSVGYSLGRQSTYYRAQAEELERAYAQRSKAAFDASYADGTGGRNGYRNGFRDTVEAYRTRPVVSLELTGVESLDTVDDGIISPGEPVALVFTLTNLGLVSTRWQATIAGRTDGAAPAFDGELSGSARRSFSSAAATISRDVPPREVAALTLDLRVLGNGERLAGSWDQTVRNVVELAGTEVDLELVSGTGTVTARAENASTLESPAEVSLALTLPDGIAQRLELGALGGAAARTVDFRIEDQDPLDLIGHRRELEITLRFGETLMETAVVSIGEPDRIQGFADYFDALHGGPIPGYVPADTDHAQRREEVVGRILEAAEAEIAHFGQRGTKNIWKTRNGAADHMVGKMARKRLVGTQNSLGEAGYRALGERLRSLAPTVRGSAKRRAFKKRVYEIERDRER